MKGDLGRANQPWHQQALNKSLGSQDESSKVSLGTKNQVPLPHLASQGQLVVLEGQRIAVGQGLSGHMTFSSSLLTSALEEGPPAEEGVRAGRKLRLGGQNAQERQGW